MKCCEKCGDEIATKDGENQCAECDKKAKRNKKARDRRRAMDAAMDSIGMKPVRGALGGRYYE
jgi:uncharacterized Zn finger protein (UPF0148 family)